MKDWTRREFLHTAAGAAVAGTIAGREPLLHGEQAPVTFTSTDQMGRTCGDKGCASLDTVIFPKPQEISSSGSDFILDDQVSILVPDRPSEQDLLLANFLRNEIADRFGSYPAIERASGSIARGRVIVMGSMQNPLVRSQCRRMGFASNAKKLGSESYILHASNNLVLIAGGDDRGAFYGLQSLRQLLTADEHGPRFQGVQVRDWPDKPFRGIYVFLPSRENIIYFKRFVRDFMALYKYNTLILEMNAGMRLDRHPELNYGWVQFARDTNYSCRNYPPDPFHGMEQNSSHQDTAGGSFLEKEEIADLAHWIRKNHIELVPSLPSFTHSYYLLTEHRSLAAVPQNKWPDIYCPSNPKSYSLVFEVYDEYIDVLKPKWVHIGHDELFLPINVSPQCHDQDIGELYGQDVKKIHDYLASRGIRTALWGDMLLQSVRGHGPQKKAAPDGWTYLSPGGLTPEQVNRLIPKDCLIYNWFWSNKMRQLGPAELNEAYLEKMGFQQVFGNFKPDIENYPARKKPESLLGGAPSAWFAPNEIGFGKDLMSDFLGCSSILWSAQVIQGRELSGRVQSMLPLLRVRMSGSTPPSQTEKSIVPVDISSKFNTGDSIAILGVQLKPMMNGMIHSSKVPFDLKCAKNLCATLVGTEGKEPLDLPQAVDSIPVGEAPTSLIFLHASAKPASNRESTRLIWDQQDTADLLGWYEVVYQDGFVTTIPIRYGVNILEWNWAERNSAYDYCYNADPLEIGEGNGETVTFFAYEWINPRLGKVIQEIRLKGTKGFRGGSDEFNNEYGPVVASNAVLLRALSLVRKRT